MKKDKYVFIPPKVEEPSPTGRLQKFVPPLQRIRQISAIKVAGLIKPYSPNKTLHQCVTADRMDRASKPARVRRRGPRSRFGRPERAR